jgi:hypothetical protein
MQVAANANTIGFELPLGARGGVLVRVNTTPVLTLTAVHAESAFGGSEPGTPSVHSRSDRTYVADH